MTRKYHLGEFEETVLLIVAVQHGQAYGMSITNVIEADLGRSVNMSSVHTALYRLEQKGFVKSEMGGASDQRGGRKKRIFSITSVGKEAILEAKEARQYLWGQMPDFVFEGNS